MSNKLNEKCKSFEMNLISAVKKKPKLHKFARLKDYKNTKELIDAWNEISRSLDVPASVCRNRWNKLLITFLNHRTIRESKDERISRCLNWPYYDPMSFLLERKNLFRSSKTSNTLDVSIEDSQSEMEIKLVQPPEVQHLPDGGGQRVKHPETHQKAEEQQLPTRNQDISLESTTKEEQPSLCIERVYSIHDDTIRTEPFTNTNNYPSSSQFIRSPTVDERCTLHAHNGPHLSCRHFDSDEQFLMSCYSTMKRLSRKRNSLVRLQIQQIMYDAEFGNEDET